MLPNGARIILNCKFFKKGTSNKSALKSLVKYIGTREGVQRFENMEDNLLPVTDSQIALINRLETSFGIGIDLPEFEDYVKDKTKLTASEYISAMIDHNMEKVATKKNLVEYIGKRPGADRDELLNHGLFCISNNGTVDKNVDINAVMDEVSNHDGRIWTNVLSLRREDAKETGFESREQWAALFRAKVFDISQQMNIPVTHLKAYGAFHDEGHHPHCHFIVYSSNPRNERLSSKGIKRLKSSFAHGIFGKQMLEIEKEKALTRDIIRNKSKDEIKELADQLESKNFVMTSELEMRLMELAKKLPQHGKKVFQLLPAELKLDVLKIVEQIAQEPEIAELYEKWKSCQTELYQFYRDDTEFKYPKLSDNESFRPVLNAVIGEAWAIRQTLDEIQVRQLFEIEKSDNRNREARQMDTSYGNIVGSIANCFRGESHKYNSVKHFDSTMDKKHQDEQRALKKRLGISM